MLDPKKEKAVEEQKKWISLTGLCNNNCIFCLDGDRKDRFHKNEKQIKREIDEGLKEGATRLVLSGGEPTIHPNILEFIRYGKEKGYKRIQIITNGRMLAYRSFVASLKETGLDEVTFSLHGHKKEIHEAMTRVPGSFTEIVRGVKNAINAGFIVNSDTTITKINYKYLPEIISYIHSLGVNEVNLMSIVPFGNAWKNRERVIYEFGEVVPYVEEVIRFCRKNNITLWFSRFPPEYLEKYPEYIESPKKILEEVLARGSSFFKKRPECYGERCRYCGVYYVCGNLVNKRYYNSEPYCFFFPAGGNARSNGFKYVKKPFKEAAGEICMNERAKKLSCSKCICNNSCHGILIKEARKGGFSSLVPIMQREIRINLSCNQNCIFCNTDKNADNFILDDSKIKNQIEAWAKEGVNYLVISGKEPTLHKKIADFIRAAKESNYKKIELQTNAVMFSDKNFARKLRKEGLTHVFVSFHSSDKSLYEKITNSKTFEKAVEGIKNLAEEGVNVSLNIVVNQINYKNLPSTIGYILKNFTDIKMVIISFVAPVCNALDNKWIIPKITDAAPYIEKAINKCDKEGIVCRIPSRCGIPVCFMPDYREHFDEIREGSRWLDGRNKLKIKKCKSCEFNNSCSGLWEDYSKIYGFS